MTSLSLFCGAGLFEEGIPADVAIDNASAALETHAANIPGVLLLKKDLSTYTAAAFLKEPAVVELGIEAGSVDLVFGGPPCKGFSTCAPKDVRAAEWMDVATNQLLIRFLEWCEALRPRQVLIENVPNILRIPAAEYVQEFLQRLGYQVEVRILNAADFGTPQARRRVFFQGALAPARVVWPRPTHAFLPRGQAPLFPGGLQPWVTVGEAFCLLAEVTDLPNSELTVHAPDFIKRLKVVEPGEGLYAKYRSSWVRLHSDRPSPTVRESHGASFIHPWLPRVITVREMACLQGIPNDFELFGTKGQQQQQVGNAVAPPVARALGVALAEGCAREGDEADDI